jgi:hypothetical protein
MPAWVAHANVCCAPGLVGDLLESNYRSRDSYETRERGEVGAAFGGRFCPSARPLRHKRKRADGPCRSSTTPTVGYVRRRSRVRGDRLR